MDLFIYNILLSLLWALLTGEVSVGSLATGFMLGYLALVLLYPATGKNPSYFQKTIQFMQAGISHHVNRGFGERIEGRGIN